MHVGSYPPYSDDLPKRCDIGEFCPDEEDACQPLLEVGSLCQLNRDGQFPDIFATCFTLRFTKSNLSLDECGPPPNWQELASPKNHNGTLCLNYRCTYVVASLFFVRGSTAHGISRKNTWLTSLRYFSSYANVTLGNPCIVENTPYFAYAAGTGDQFINVVSRCVQGSSSSKPRNHQADFFSSNITVVIASLGYTVTPFSFNV